MPENQIPPTLYIVDASAYIFKNFHGMRERLSTTDGQPVQAVFGYIRTLIRLLRTRAPAYLTVAFDAKGPTFRNDIYPEYKANRPPPPPSLPEQYQLCVEGTEALGIRGFSISGLEADDLIGTLVTRWHEETAGRSIIVGTDKDMLQLVNEDVLLWDGADHEYGPLQVIEKLGVRADQVIDLLGLAGDSSDNIPGVPGIGMKTAAQLLNQYDRLENLLACAHEVKGKRGESLRQFKDQARLSAQLATIKCDADFLPTGRALKELLSYRGPLLARADDFMNRFGFERLKSELRAKGINHLPNEEALHHQELLHSTPRTASDQTQKLELGAHSPLGEEVAKSGSSLPEQSAISSALRSSPVSLHVDRSQYQCLINEVDLTRVVQLIKAANILSIDLETTSLNINQAEILGVALAWGDNQAAYIPMGHFYLGVPTQLTPDQVWSQLRPLLADPALPKVCQNHKYDRKVLAVQGIESQGWMGDPMLMAYLLDPTRLSFGLDSLSEDLLSHINLTFKEVAGKSGEDDRFRLVTVERATEYAAEDADIALRLYHVLLPQLQAKPELFKLYVEVELPLNTVLVDMEMTGIRLDLDSLKTQSAEMRAQLLKLQAEIYELSGGDFNIDSPRQLSMVLFDRLQLEAKKGTKKTKTGQLSTSHDQLELLKDQHPIIEKLLEYRHLAKLKNTYLDALPALVDSHTGRLHTSFKQTGTATGRLSSSDPNLQNIPLRTPEGRRIREAFVTESGWSLISADYSQVELRLLAHFAGAEGLIQGFKEGVDIHAATACELFNVTPEELTADQRRSAKAINFGLMYGMGPKKLSETVGVSYNEAKEMIQTYFEKYGEVRAFFSQAVSDAELNEASLTLMGRYRPLPEINRSGRLKAQAERLAVNTPIQGTAADILKVAMISLHKALKESGLQARMLLTVHDELVLEALDEHCEQVAQLTQACMEQAVLLSVPLAVEVGIGPSWAEIH